jgi:hypothetical protein
MEEVPPLLCCVLLPVQQLVIFYFKLDIEGADVSFAMQQPC